jgi:hypothetical protein
MLDGIHVALLVAAGAVAMGCGAHESDMAGGSREASEPPRPTRSEPAALAEPDPTPTTEPVAEAPGPPRPAPVEVEAGARLGPVRIGMSEDEVRALGLEEHGEGSRGRRFGPYRVFFTSAGAVRRVEAPMGALGRIRVGERVFEVGTDIHVLRDAFGPCEWEEGGGERYRCADGTLFVQTTHSLRPERYTLAVEAP